MTTKHARLTVLFLTLLVPIKLATAQNSNLVTVATSPAGASFLVDGYSYVGPQTFNWPTGTKHNIQFQVSVDANGNPLNYQETSDGQTRYSFNGWSLSNGAQATSQPSITVQSDPTLSSILLNVSQAVRLQIHFSSFPLTDITNCSATSVPQDFVRPGVVIVNGSCLGSDGNLWVPTGQIQMAAYPFAGFVFAGWSVGPTGQSSLTFNVVGPTTIAARFVQAKRVTFRTDPPGLSVLVDRTTTPTIDTMGVTPNPGTCPFNLGLPNVAPITIPILCYGDFDFMPGSSHVISAPSPQYDLTGHVWVIDSFSNGLKPNDTYIAPATTSTNDLITAKFIPGEQVAFGTNPVGLKVNVDGRSNWLSYNFTWGLGTQHTFSAADQPDAHFRRWVLKGWSNGGPNSQTLTVTGPARITANFDVLPQVVLQSTPPGITLQVDGASCTTPCLVDRPMGTVVKVSAPATIPVTDLSRMETGGWSDGGTPTRVVTFDTDQKYLTVNYQTTFKVLASGDPASGATFTFNPPSTDNFFPQNSPVSVTATAKNGYRFRRWGGDLTGTYNQGTLSMTSPHQVTALLDQVPYIADAGIHSAAGVTPDGTVAPGSLISIMGYSLAAGTVQNSSTPLSQGLGGVDVLINNRLLPLVFVSPQEIRGQLFSDLPDGVYTATVQSQGMPDITGSFTVARNSPGLFPDPNQDLTALAGGTPLAWATHADGSAVNASAPAAQGESITLYATGLGPTNGFVLDGFAVPTAGDYSLKDALQINAGGVTLNPDSASAVSGQVGIQMVKFTITSDLPTGTIIPVTVTVNGKTSNTVNLTLQ